MRRRPTLLLPALAFGLAVLTIAGIFVVTRLLSQADCGASDPVLATSVGTASLDASQRATAAVVINEGRRLRVPTQGIVIALAVANQESRFLNYANDGLGGDLVPDQRGIGRSLGLPHEAVGSDHGSLGVFQQQWPWWGSMSDLMNPARAAGKFYRALLDVSGWQSMPVTVAAQRVQRSAFPSRYADDEALARAILRGTATTSSRAASISLLPTEPCLNDASAAGTVVYPLPRDAHFVDLHNWGRHGAHWARMHTGTDLSSPCGTPVLAATGGVVVVRTDQSWAGRWLVEVSTAPHAVTTWYAHMRALSVRAGQTVTAGQRIGEVGDLGNATGCHLHFEVHTKNGSIYGPDNVNPTTWLSQHVGKPLTVIPAVQHGRSGSDSSGGFRLVTFNILGSSHTRHRGADQHPSWPSGSSRVPGMLRTLNHWGTDVAGLQEVQPDQRYAIARLSQGEYQMYPPAGSRGDNRVLWRTSTFTLLDTTSFSIPYFNGHRSPIPVVLLQQRSTGHKAWFASVHNPAETSRYHHQGVYRGRAIAAERAFARRMATGAIPVFILGDFNAKSSAFCPLAHGGLLHSASGGNVGEGCHPPAQQQIDWIFGTPETRFTGYHVDETPQRAHISDHPVVIAQADIG